MKKKALISVSNKTGIVDFAKALVELGYDIISTGGTAKTLQKNGIEVIEISAYTGFPEMLDGRVKTLHPKIHAGILALRDRKEHIETIATHGIELLDMVVVNLYPFEETIARPDISLETAIEQIDIGGPTLLRAAAKNYRFVTVIVDPSDYEPVLRELREKGDTSLETRYNLAVKVFSHTARYDGIISQFLSSRDHENRQKEWPEVVNFQFHMKQSLRYGENPHQKAAFYMEKNPPSFSLARAKQYQGKELSFNNIVDAEAAFRLISEFREGYAAAGIKHTNPCGVGLSEKSQLEAFLKAKEGDPVSIFGGIVAFNTPVEPDTAEELSKMFLEVIIAPGYTPEALEILSRKKNLRVLEVPLIEKSGGYDIKRVVGGILIQEWDSLDLEEDKLKVVTKRSPTPEEMEALRFAWKVVKHVKSNAIVVARKDQVLGVGAGQMSRVDSVKIAIEKAGDKAKGAVLASDAFFPFPDSIEEAHRAGITAIIEPGGSIRDEEVIKAADQFGIAMIFTGIRHFKH